MDSTLSWEVHIPGVDECVRERCVGETSTLRGRMCLRLQHKKERLGYLRLCVTRVLANHGPVSAVCSWAIAEYCNTLGKFVSARPCKFSPAYLASSLPVCLNSRLPTLPGKYKRSTQDLFIGLSVLSLQTGQARDCSCSMDGLCLHLGFKTCQLAKLDFWPRCFKSWARQLCGLGVPKTETALLNYETINSGGMRLSTHPNTASGRKGRCCSVGNWTVYS